MSEIQFMEKNGNSDIGVYISEFNGKEYLHVREHYIEARTGERKPTKKGVALSIEKAAELHALLGDVLAEVGVQPAKPAKPAKAKASPKATVKASPKASPKATAKS